MRLYYLTGAQYALSSLALRRIKVARFEDLNDPFELLGVELRDPGHRKAFRATKKQINENRGLICFSKTWSNPLLWGHYAEKHTGVCLGFDIPDGLLAPVIYAKRLRKMRFDPNTGLPVLSEPVMNKLHRTKFWDWRYEKEMRLFVGLDRDTLESGMYFCSFAADLALREVILGPRCELRIEAIREMVAEFHPPVDVLKARLSFRQFKVLVDRSASRSSPWNKPINMQTRPWLSSLAFLAFYVNAAIDGGHGQEMSFTDIHNGIEKGTLFEDLERLLPGALDLSLFRPESDQRKGVLEALQIVSGGLQGRERRKVGVEKSGLSLLLAFLIEAMQQKYWVKPRVSEFRKVPQFLESGTKRATARQKRS